MDWGVLGEPLSVDIVVDGSRNVADYRGEDAQEVQEPFLETVHRCNLLKKTIYNHHI